MTQRRAAGIEPPFPPEAIAELEERLGRSLQGWEITEPAYHSPSPGDDVEGAWFDVAAVVKVVEQLRDMPHTIGRWGGTPFEPATWQIVWILAPVFGWKKADGYRIVTEAWLEVGRKNGKTSLSARLGLILLAGDGEYGAEVYSAAGSKDQAGFLFAPARSVAETSPALKGRLEVLAHLIRAPRTGGIFRVLSKAGELAHGASPHGGLIDEIHIHKDRGLIDAIDSGTGARAQPLIFYTTTANDGDDQTIYGELHGRAVRLAKGEATDQSTYVVIWCADAADDPFAEATIRKANPNYPESPTREYIERKIRKAQDTPTWLPIYKRLHLNVRTAEAAEAWKGSEVWSEGSRLLVVDDQMKGHRAWGGLVCASSTDLAALAWVIQDGDTYLQRWRWFLPEGALDDLDRRTAGAASVWAKDRITLTEGDVIDTDAVIDRIEADCRWLDAKKLAYDPNGTIGIITKIVESNAVDVIPVYPTNPASALLDWERLLISGKIGHGGDPIAAWEVGHVRVKPAATGVVKINRRDSTENVFGIAAAEIALRMALMEQERKPGRLVLTYS